eukprot:4341770-Pyramimonas_sp.AAC.1
MDVVQYAKFGLRTIAIFKAAMVMYGARGCDVLCYDELRRAMPRRPWRRNPDRTDMDLTLELPQRP